MVCFIIFRSRQKRDDESGPSGRFVGEQGKRRDGEAVHARQEHAPENLRPLVILRRRQPRLADGVLLGEVGPQQSPGWQCHRLGHRGQSLQMRAYEIARRRPSHAAAIGQYSVWQRHSGHDRSLFTRPIYPSDVFLEGYIRDI